MSGLQVYEYYDGYEFEADRRKVQYFVLGVTDSDHVAICYVGDCSLVAKIGQRTHSRAWKQGMIGCKEAIACIEKYCDETVSSVDDEIKEMISNKELLDKEHACLPGYSVSGSVGIYEHFHYKHGESYTEKKIEALINKRNLLYIRDEFLISLKHALSPAIDIDTAPETHPEV